MKLGVLALASAAILAGTAANAGMLDVTCSVDVVVGHGSITVRECLKLERDSIIRLSKPAGADLLVQIQGVAAATGEIVVDDETTSVRIAEILPPPGTEVGS